jgi:hypothetical protein
VKHAVPPGFGRTFVSSTCPELTAGLLVAVNGIMFRYRNPLVVSQTYST